MYFYFGSMALTVIANIVYHVCQKSIKADANPLASLFVTYAIGMLITVMIYPLFYPGENAIVSLRQLGPASYLLGFGIVGLELGFLLAYRAGWNISIAALYSNIAVTLALIPIGYFLYKDMLSLKQLFGAALAIVGLVLLKSK